MWLSERGLAATEETDDDELNGNALFRPLFPYRELLEKMLEKCNNAKLKLNSAVTAVTWTKNRVEIQCGKNKYLGQKLIVTVPLGVLKKERISFLPRPPQLDQLDCLQVGHVQKLIFKFKDRFWEKLSAKPISFLHTSAEFYFPTWWTFQPLRTNYLVAWQGGPKALEMATWSKEKLIETAFKTLSALTRKNKKWLKSEMVSCEYHNWTKDIYAEGAYSYVSKDGLDVSKQLSRPNENTIFWAGEALQPDSARASVHGAIQSGKKAATELLKTF